jgi:hypothetical protein
MGAALGLVESPRKKELCTLKIPTLPVADSVPAIESVLLEQRNARSQVAAAELSRTGFGRGTAGAQFSAFDARHPVPSENGIAQVRILRPARIAICATTMTSPALEALKSGGVRVVHFESDRTAHGW